MRTNYAPRTTGVWDEEEDDLNVTRELELAQLREAAVRDCSPEITPPADPPARWQQDTQPVDGEAALHPPPDGGRVQG